MVCRLIDIATLVLKLLMFKICGIIGVLKIEFFNFSGFVVSLFLTLNIIYSFF